MAVHHTITTDCCAVLELIVAGTPMPHAIPPLAAAICALCADFATALLVTATDDSMLLVDSESGECIKRAIASNGLSNRNVSVLPLYRMHLPTLFNDSRDPLNPWSVLLSVYEGDFYSYPRQLPPGSTELKCGRDSSLKLSVLIESRTAVATGCGTTVTITDLPSGAVLQQENLAIDHCSSLSLHPRGGFIVGDRGKLHWFDEALKKNKGTIRTTTSDCIGSQCVSGDKKRLVACQFYSDRLLVVALSDKSFSKCEATLPIKEPRDVLELPTGCFAVTTEKGITIVNSLLTAKTKTFEIGPMNGMCLIPTSVGRRVLEAVEDETRNEAKK